MSARSVETFIAQYEPNENSNRFFIGPFESGITIFKQQTRALNLLYALHESKRITANTKIAVVGGGVAGITAAAAAVALGSDVYLFEHRPILLHLQHGCDTRWVHPHIYEWPDPGSNEPYAGLPLLDWRESTASEIVEQLLTEFTHIAKSESTLLHIHQGASVSLVGPLRVKWEHSLATPYNREMEFDMVIFAVGFGVERGVDRDDTPSYWRNDSINQPKPGFSINKKIKYLIS